MNPVQPKLRTTCVEKSPEKKELVAGSPIKELLSKIWRIPSEQWFSNFCVSESPVRLVKMQTFWAPAPRFQL